jgi:hypothetical protein
MTDARLPVHLAKTASASDPDCLVVADAGARLSVPDGAVVVPFRAHLAGCVCCGGRAPFASMLGRLFAERARGERPFFRGIVALSDEAGLQAVREALETDGVLAGLYKEVRPGALPLDQAFPE